MITFVEFFILTLITKTIFLAVLECYSGLNCDFIYLNSIMTLSYVCESYTFQQNFVHKI